MKEYKTIADFSPFHRNDLDQQVITYGPWRGHFAWLRAYWNAEKHIYKHPCGAAQVLFREIK